MTAGEVGDYLFDYSLRFHPHHRGLDITDITREITSSALLIASNRLEPEIFDFRVQVSL